MVFGSPMAERGLHPWGTLSRTCIPCSWPENNESDGIDKIQAVTDKLFSGFERYNMKVIPRVYLYWPGAGKVRGPIPTTWRGFSGPPT